MAQLPPSCIRSIVFHLREDIYTLANLLTVNSTFFHITLPVLYHDPYRLLERQIIKDLHRQNPCSYPSAFESSLAAKRLLYLLLLSCRQADDLVPFLSLDWPNPLILSEGQKLTVSYIDFLGDLDFDRWTATLKHLIPEIDTLMEQRAYRLFRILFLDHHKENVEQLTIPITHLEPYQKWVGSFKNLKRVKFYEDTLDEEEEAAAAAQVEEPVAVEVEAEAVEGEESAGQVQPQEDADRPPEDNSTSSNDTSNHNGTTGTVTDASDMTSGPTAEELELFAAVAAIEAAVNAANAAAELAAAAQAEELLAAAAAALEEDPESEDPEADIVLPAFVAQFLNPTLHTAEDDVDEDDDLEWVFVEQSLFTEPDYTERPPSPKDIRPSVAVVLHSKERQPVEEVDRETVNTNAFTFMAFHGIDIDDLNNYKGPTSFSIFNTIQFFVELPFSPEEEEVEEEPEEVEELDPLFGFSELAFGDDTRFELEIEYQRDLFADLAFGFDFGDGLDEVTDDMEQIEEPEADEEEIAEQNFLGFSELAFWDDTLEDLLSKDNLELFAAMAFPISEEEERERLEQEAQEKFGFFAEMALWGEIREELEILETLNTFLLMPFGEDNSEEEVAPIEAVDPPQQDAAPAQEPAQQDTPVEVAQQEEEPAQEPAAPARPPLDTSIKGAAFLKAHRKHFPQPPAKISVFSPAPKPWLQEIIPPSLWTHSNWSGKATHDQKYTRLLDAITCPDIIEFDEWEHYATYIDRLPLSRVKRLRRFCTDWIDQPDVNMARFLQRCRSLERFSSQFDDDKIFRWAIEEKRDRRNRMEQIRQGIARKPFEDEPCMELVPLKKVVLRHGREEHLVPVLKDICEGFDTSLEWIEARIYSDLHKTNLDMFTAMPRLTVLYLHHTRHERFTNGAAFLKDCPSLEVLRLIDGDYVDYEVNRKPMPLGEGIQEAWDLPLLTDLELVGSMATMFNYSTLANSPKLKTLILECDIEEIGVRSVDEHFHEYLAQWSWNWPMPALEHCCVRGMHGHIFRFSWADHCPRLKILTVDLRKTVRRAITVARDIPSDPSSVPAFRASLQELNLLGRWDFTESPSILTAFLQLPSLASMLYLYIDLTDFYSPESTVQGLRSAKSLRKAQLTRNRISKYDAWKLGLELETFKSDREWDRSYRARAMADSVINARKEAELERLRQAAWERECVEAEKGVQDLFELMEEALPNLDDMETEDEAANESVAAKVEEDFAKDRSRCVSVDSACELGEDTIDSVLSSSSSTLATSSSSSSSASSPTLSSSSSMIMEGAESESAADKESLEAEKEPIQKECERCVYVFRGIRYRNNKSCL